MKRCVGSVARKLETGLSALFDLYVDLYVRIFSAKFSITNETIGSSFEDINLCLYI